MFCVLKYTQSKLKETGLSVTFSHILRSLNNQRRLNLKSECVSLKTHPLKVKTCFTLIPT